ncbi:MAG: DUF4412 domain-containing protein, partial [Bacteroidia bacterium]|nr:DUF4412 domain-containing protein [Bacteroidia bacterium]
VILLFGISTPGHSQIFKKLSKRAKEAAEQTVERKVAEKTERETEKTFDTIFNNQGKLFKNKKVTPAESYSFSHTYIMEVISGKDTTDITYYLTNENEYMGSSFQMRDDQEFITVMDLPNSAIHSFMNLDGQKSCTSIKIDLDDVSDTELNANKFSISPTGQTKKIIGYDCQEYQVTGPQLSGKVWVTQDADISFQKAFTQMKSKKMKLNKGVDQSWVSMIDGLALEMKMIDYSRKNPESIYMLCKDIRETDFSINTSEYQNQF